MGMPKLPPIDHDRALTTKTFDTKEARAKAILKIDAVNQAGPHGPTTNYTVYEIDDLPTREGKWVLFTQPYRPNMDMPKLPPIDHDRALTTKAFDTKEARAKAILDIEAANQAGPHGPNANYTVYEIDDLPTREGKWVLFTQVCKAIK